MGGSNSELEDNIREVESKFSSATDALVQSYDDHMKKIIPKPKLLPIRISVIVECKNNMRLENIHIKPYDNLHDLLKLIEEVQVKKGDGIVDWNKRALNFVLSGPLANFGKDVAHVRDEEGNVDMDGISG